MSALVCVVKQTYPVTMLSVAGTLDDRTMIESGLVIRDCLAALPAAVVVDAHGLRVVGERAVPWLRQILLDAAVWPGVPLLFVDPDGVCGGLDVPCHESAAAAAAAADRVHEPAKMSVTLPPLAASCAAARELVREACGSWGKPRYAQVGELIASELVANGVVHARTELALTVRDHDGLQISVGDGDPRFAELGGEGGQGTGLELVAGLAERWGCLPTSTGKVVWATLGPTVPSA